MQTIVEQHRDACVIAGREPGSKEDIRFLALALAGEAGELANLIKKEWMGFKDPGGRREQIEEELADVNSYLFLITYYFTTPVNMLAAIDRKIVAFWDKLRMLETGETK
jgi:NTP pyrophosphatase (non-canonical NTP hydrolase)